MRRGALWTVLGVLLLGTALGLTLRNLRQDRQAGDAAAAVTAQLTRESAARKAARAAETQPAADGAAEKAVLSGKASYEQKKEQEKLLRKLRKAVESVETELAELEKRIAEYDAKFAAATDYNEADYTAYNDLKSRYDHQMHEWEKASYELEITEEQYNG